VVPAFEVRPDVYLNLPVAQLEAHFEEIVDSAYSVSLFTDWQNERVNQVWVKRHSAGGDSGETAPALFEATPAPRQIHPIASLPAEACTAQLGVPGPVLRSMPHFRIDELRSSGAELQAEYFVPRQHAVAALRAVTALHEQIAPLLMISEVRTIAADNLWMSPCYQQACVAIHFTWKLNWEGVRQLLPEIEAQLAPFDARPHWGKLFTMAPARLHSLYQKLPDFQRLLTSYDPQGKFRNPFLDTYTLGLRVPRNNAGSRASGRRRRGSPGARAACPGCPAPRSAR